MYDILATPFVIPELGQIPKLPIFFMADLVKSTYVLADTKVATRFRTLCNILLNDLRANIRHTLDLGMMAFHPIRKDAYAAPICP